MSRKLPLQHSVETEISLPAKGDGVNVAFDETVHCVAAEPRETIIRASVTENGQMIAYETAVLGRFRHGYRILQLRGPLGTRIELCYLLIQVTFGEELNKWATPRQVRQLTPKRWAARTPFTQFGSVGFSHYITTTHDFPPCHSYAR